MNRSRKLVNLALEGNSNVRVIGSEPPPEQTISPKAAPSVSEAEALPKDITEEQPLHNEELNVTNNSSRKVHSFPSASRTKRVLFQEDEDDVVPSVEDNSGIEFLHSFEPEISLDSPTVDDEGEDSNAIDPDFVTPPTGNRKRRSTSGTSSGSPKRKRVTQEHLWKRNVRKTLKNSGKAYISSTGKERPEVQMRGPCACKMDCRHRLKEDQRRQIHKTFWELGKHDRQWEFIRVNSSSKSTKPRHPGQILMRSVSRSFHFIVDDCQVRICKQMFIRTLGICDSWITSAHKHVNPDKGYTVSPDKRGGYKKRQNNLTQQRVDSVKEHINSFPRVPSHYCRKRTKREYLENGLSIAKMARLYKTWAQEKNLPTTYIASPRQYRDILNTNFNIGFYKPKKDQCAFCSIMRNKHNTRGIREQRKADWVTHINNKKKARELKTRDVEESLRDKTVVACSFDLQKQLSCPKSEDGVFYYKTKLKVFNFTVFNMTERMGNCYLWHEGIGKKGSSEISSALLMYIESLVQKGYTDLRFWSDNCGGQNKNRFLFAMYEYAAVKYGIKITHRYLEPGHTQMEADSIHARIESATEKESIYDFETWVEWIEKAKEKMPMYRVKRLTKASIFSFKSLVDMQNWDKDLQRKDIKWSKMKEVHVNGQEGNLIRMKYNFNSESYVTMSPNNVGRPVNLKTFELPRAYESAIPLSATTIKHLTWLCDENYVPVLKQGFLRDLLAGLEPVEVEEVSDIEYDTEEDEVLEEEDENKGEEEDGNEKENNSAEEDDLND